MQDEIAERDAISSASVVPPKPSLWRRLQFWRAAAQADTSDDEQDEVIGAEPTPTPSEVQLMLIQASLEEQRAWRRARAEHRAAASVQASGSDDDSRMSHASHSLVRDCSVIFVANQRYSLVCFLRRFTTIATIRTR